MIKKINLNDKKSTMTDAEKIAEVLKSFSYEDKYYKVYHSTKWGTSSCGFYRQADYLFKIDKKHPKVYKGFIGFLSFINDKITIGLHGGLRQNLITIAKPSGPFIDEKYFTISIKEPEMLNKIEKRLESFEIETEIKLIYREII